MDSTYTSVQGFTLSGKKEVYACYTDFTRHQPELNTHLARMLTPQPNTTYADRLNIARQIMEHTADYYCFRDELYNDTESAMSKLFTQIDANFIDEQGLFCYQLILLGLICSTNDEYRTLLSQHEYNALERLLLPAEEGSAETVETETEAETEGEGDVTRIRRAQRRLCERVFAGQTAEQLKASIVAKACTFRVDERDLTAYVESLSEGDYTFSSVTYGRDGFAVKCMMAAQLLNEHSDLTVESAVAMACQGVDVSAVATALREGKLVSNVAYTILHIVFFCAMLISFFALYALALAYPVLYFPIYAFFLFMIYDALSGGQFFERAADRVSDMIQEFSDTMGGWWIALKGAVQKAAKDFWNGLRRLLGMGCTTPDSDYARESDTSLDMRTTESLADEDIFVDEELDREHTYA